jgi:hypothetical protein
VFLIKKKRPPQKQESAQLKDPLLRKREVKRGHNYAPQIPEKIFNQDSKTKK